MRKIEETMCAAVKARMNYKSGNTEVVISDGGSKAAVYLHGNKIYMESSEGWAWFSLCGWNTSTTRSRLNALGVHVYQRNWMPYYNGEEISSKEVYKIPIKR